MFSRFTRYGNTFLSMAKLGNSKRRYFMDINEMLQNSHVGLGPFNFCFMINFYVDLNLFKIPCFNTHVLVVEGKLSFYCV